MAKTHWVDRGTQEILSSHINGLQQAVGKIEDSLDMSTADKTEQALSLVVDTNGHRRLAEATDRNWLESPAPVIEKLNGAVWDTITTGFTIDYSGGALLFDSDQTGESFRASFRHIINESDFDTHKSDSMPHQFVDDGTTYRYGFKGEDGHLVFMYEEVV